MCTYQVTTPHHYVATSNELVWKFYSEIWPPLSYNSMKISAKKLNKRKETEMKYKLYLIYLFLKSAFLSTIYNLRIFFRQHITDESKKHISWCSLGSPQVAIFQLKSFRNEQTRTFLLLFIKSTRATIANVLLPNLMVTQLQILSPIFAKFH